MTALDPAEQEALEQAAAWVGRTVADKFVLDRLLGVGGMGAVYEATNSWTGRKVAVKMLLSSALRNREAIARLQQEARAATSIAHPHILDVLDLYRDQSGNCFIVTELLVGQSLEALLEQQPVLDPYHAVELMVPIAAALATAHKRGIVHRDIKPGNIYLHTDPDGHVVPKLIDFGISKVSDETIARTRTRTGAVIGTVDYMSPEQARGEQVDAQTDVWALGVVLFRLLSGMLPYDGPTINSVLIAIATKRAPRLIDVAPRVPAALGAIVDRMLEPSKDTRYPSFVRVLRDLLGWADPQRRPTLSERYRKILPPLDDTGPIRLPLAMQLSAIPAIGEYDQEEATEQTKDEFSEMPTTLVLTGDLPALATAPVGVSPATKMEWQSQQRVHPPTPIQSQQPRRRAAVWIAVGSAATVAMAITLFRGGADQPSTSRTPTHATVTTAISVDAAPQPRAAVTTTRAVADAAPPVAQPTAEPTAVAAEPSHPTARPSITHSLSNHQSSSHSVPFAPPTTGIRQQPRRRPGLSVQRDYQ